MTGDAPAPDHWEEMREARRPYDERWMEATRQRYEHDGNPLHAWNAYIMAREAGYAIPEWVLTYLDHAAGGLWTIVQQQSEGRPPANPSTAIAEALGMKEPGRGGRGTVFSRFGDTRWLWLGALLSLRAKRGDKPYIAAAEIAATEGVDTSTVLRAWERFKREVPLKVE